MTVGSATGPVTSSRHPSTATPEGSPPAPWVTFGESRRNLTVPRWIVLAAAAAAQAGVARVMFLVPSVALLHAGTLLLVAGWAVLRRKPVVSLMVVAYATGAEIMWRQARGGVPYTLGPYLTIFVALASIATLYPSISRSGRRALLYVALLLPSALITVAVTAGKAREFLVFALAGPFTLTALILWLSQVRVEPWLYRRVLWTVVIAGVGPLTIAATNISDYIGAGNELTFSDSSNFVASGGFGPVQVSSVLGLTVLAALILATVEVEFTARALAVVLGVAAATQSLLTFSRGGMFSTAFAVAALALVQAGDRQGRRRVLVVIGLVFAVGYFVVVPRLDNFTEGQFNERFTDTESGRTELAANDIEIFGRNPVTGVGPGLAKYQRIPYEICQLRSDACKDEASSHTEFTRMLGEHGLAGLIAIGVLASLVVTAMVQAGRNRGYVAALLTWSIAQMVYANLRVVAVAFAFAFAFVRMGAADEELEPEPDDATGRTSPPALAPPAP